MDNLVYIWPDGASCSREELSNQLEAGRGEVYAAVTEEDFYNTPINRLCKELFDASDDD